MPLDGEPVMTATVEELASQLPAFLDLVAGGEQVVIVRDGMPVGTLGPPPPIPKGTPVYGRAKGMLIIHEEDDDHLSDFAELNPPGS